MTSCLGVLDIISTCKDKRNSGHDDITRVILYISMFEYNV